MLGLFARKQFIIKVLNWILMMISNIFSKPSYYKTFIKNDKLWKLTAFNNNNKSYHNYIKIKRIR